MLSVEGGLHRFESDAAVGRLRVGGRVRLRVATVSYTHLDVYKRQRGNRVLQVRTTYLKYAKNLPLLPPPGQVPRADPERSSFMFRCREAVA